MTLGTHDADDRSPRGAAIFTGSLARAASMVVCLSLAGNALGCRRNASAASDSVALTVNQQPVTFALLEFSRVSGWPIVIAPAATDVAACVRISVLAAQPIPKAQLRQLVLRALEPTPLDVQEQSMGWIVRRREGVALPESCSGLAFRESSLADLERRRRERQELVANGTPSLDVDAGAAAAVTEDALFSRILQGITASGENTYSVTSDALEAFLANSEAVSRRVRIVPQATEGAIRGMKVFGIRRGSVFAALGLQNGDTITSINDTPLTNPELALEAYSRVRSAREIRVRIQRSGAEQTLTYVVQRPAAQPSQRH